MPGDGSFSPTAQPWGSSLRRLRDLRQQRTARPRSLAAPGPPLLLSSTSHATRPVRGRRLPKVGTAPAHPVGRSHAMAATRTRASAVTICSSATTGTSRPSSLERGRVLPRLPRHPETRFPLNLGDERPNGDVTPQDRRRKHLRLVNVNIHPDSASTSRVPSEDAPIRRPAFALCEYLVPLQPRLIA